MADASRATELPRLAYVYRPNSFDTLALFEAARGVCRLVWVTDSSRAGTSDATRLLRRLGEVLDVAGLSVAGAASLIAEQAPDGILCLADEGLQWTADIADQLRLEFHSPACARRLTDKREQRAALAHGGLAVPRSWQLLAGADEPQLQAIVADQPFPAVLKPRTGEGSRDTFPVASLPELRSALATSAEHGGVDRPLVLESYIPDAPEPLGGEGFAGYLSVESAVADGVICHLATNGRMPPAYPFRETGFFIPSAVEGNMLEAVLAVATDAIRAIGVTIGCLHTEIKLTPDGPVVIEVNGRIGGGVPEMLERATGAQLLTLAMRLALGERPPCIGLLPTSCLSFLFYVHAPTAIGVVTAIEGTAEVRATAGVEEVVLRRVVGDHVDWREGNHGHVLSVFGTANDHEGLRSIQALLDATLRIEISS